MLEVFTILFFHSSKFLLTFNEGGYFFAKFNQIFLLIEGICILYFVTELLRAHFCLEVAHFAHILSSIFGGLLIITYHARIFIIGLYDFIILGRIF